MPQITIREIGINYLTGSRKWPERQKGLVLIHGAGSSGLVWFGQKKALGAKRWCCCLDLPGHGRSGGRPLARLEDYVPCLIDLIKALKLGQVSLIGHSMGGAVALKAALTAPELVDRVAVICSGARLPVADRIMETATSDPSIIKSLLYPAANPDRITDRRIKALLATIDPEIMAADLAACRRLDLTDRIAQLARPLLVLAGANDRLLAPEIPRQLADSVPDAKYQTIADAGHLALLEQPQRVNSLLTAFLDAPNKPGE